MLSDEDIWNSDALMEHNAQLGLPMFMYGKLVRAIESAATAPLLAEIERLTRELEEARKDAEMLDWLDNNIFAREPDEWDQRYGVCRDGKTQMWAIFAPKGVHGSARKIIAAAIKEQT